MLSTSGPRQGVAISPRRRRSARRAIAVGLSAAALILVAACSSGSGSATAPLTPRQALLTAATHARQVTSATETLTVQDSGTSSSTTTGIIRIRRKPTLLISGNLNTTASGTNTQIGEIVTGTAIYVHQASLASQVGKPWVQIDLSALAGAGGAGLAQLFHSLESNNFANQAQLFALVKSVRVVGSQTVDGVPTTEYAGSSNAASLGEALPAGLRQALAPGLQALGNSAIYFHEWIDGQHHLRKMTEVETLNGETINTTINLTAINQPVSITLPPASQTFILQGTSPVSGKSGKGPLSAKVVAAPSGFVLSQAAGVHNGPMSAADFNQTIGGNQAATLHFVRGYHVTYDSNSNSIQVFVFQFAAPADATVFETGSLSVAPGKPKADLVIPGAEDYDATSPSQGMFDHGVIAIKGSFVFVIDEATGSAAPAPVVETMARQQYAAL
jgi:hypothetical protein